MKKIFLATLVALMYCSAVDAQIETMVKSVIKEDPMLETKASTTWDSEHMLILQYTETGTMFFCLKTNEGLFDEKTKDTKVGLYDSNGELLSMSIMWHIYNLDISSKSVSALIMGYNNEDKETLYRQKMEELPEKDQVLKDFFEYVVMPEHLLEFMKNNPNGYVRVTTTLKNGKIFDAKARLQK